MLSVQARRPLMLAGLTLLAVGLERLLNAYLLGIVSGHGSAPLVVGVVCAVAGVALVAASLVPGRPSRS
jgi:hypothetical protein